MSDVVFVALATLFVVAGAVGWLLFRKSAESRKLLADANAALEDRVTMVERHMPTPMVVFDARGLIRRVNPAAEQLFGYRQPELYGQNVLRIMPASPDAMHGDTTIRHKDGTLVAVHFRVARSESARREIYLFFDQPKAVETVERPVIVQEARPSLTVVEGVVNRIVREFESLLTQINGYTELAMHAAPPDSPVQNDLKELAAASDTASSLARNLLAFSGNQTIPTQVVDLNVLLASMEPAIRDCVKDAIVIERGDERAAILGNADCLRQVILLLAKSAHHRAASSGESAAVRVKSTRLKLPEDKPVYTGKIPAGEYGALLVFDDGAPLRPSTMEHLFEPLFLDGENVGVELAPIYGIARSMGGWIDVTSEAGAGNTFALYFPYSGDVQVGSNAKTRAIAG